MYASRSKMVFAAACSALAMLASGCSGLGVDDTKAGLSCVDDTPECVASRQATLNAMLADKENKWVREPATPQAHASGVRLFAFRTRKKELNCEELAYARREADGAAKILRGPDGKGLSPAQISRATMFAAEVSKELTAEMRSRRCKA
ncbi:MAG: hypothetical protein F9K29_14140 [Hyphomicrobiaceae bacterium]|nr:MAG: hypothetical protein F9K29_14140 [Hyphomicrobiaceae bacterium]